MERVFEVICYVALAVLGFVVLLAALTRGLGSFVALVQLFLHSPLPWWILAPAAIALIAGLSYLFRKNLRRRIPPNQKFVN